MITVKGKTTIAALSELRNKSDEILKHLKDHKVILQKHNAPVAVLEDFRKYELMERMLDFAEDYILGLLARERDRKASAKDFVDIEKW